MGEPSSLPPPPPPPRCPPGPSTTAAPAAAAIQDPPPPPPPPSPLSLSIRFAVSLPDLPIFIPRAASTTVCALKRQIRAALPAEQSRRRLRLIHAGRVLADSGTLASQISAPKAPPKPASAKGKEKAVTATAEDDELERLRRVVYIHCSVGDELSDEELAEEAEDKEQTAPAAAAPPRTTLPQPLGFDRLLSAGFTESDVASLRSQFNRLHGYNRDEEEGENARLLEDRWIDESAGQGAELADGSPAGSYEDMFVGTAIGFFWPVAIFLMREEGVFTKRRQMAIVAGLLVNLAFSVLRISS